MEDLKGILLFLFTILLLCYRLSNLIILFLDIVHSIGMDARDIDVVCQEVGVTSSNAIVVAPSNGILLLIRCLWMLFLGDMNKKKKTRRDAEEESHPRELQQPTRYRFNTPLPSFTKALSMVLGKEFSNFAYHLQNQMLSSVVFDYGKDILQGANADFQAFMCNAWEKILEKHRVGFDKAIRQVRYKFEIWNDVAFDMLMDVYEGNLVSIQDIPRRTPRFSSSDPRYLSSCYASYRYPNDEY